MKIQYNRPNTYSAEGVTLLPGVNIVPVDLAGPFLANAGVQSRIRMGAIAVLDAPEGDEITVDDVPDMADVAALRELAAGDKRRAEVKAAIARLAEIDATVTAG
jgi:hypothetical protein